MDKSKRTSTDGTFFNESILPFLGNPTTKQPAITTTRPTTKTPPIMPSQSSIYTEDPTSITPSTIEIVQSKSSFSSKSQSESSISSERQSIETMPLPVQSFTSIFITSQPINSFSTVGQSMSTSLLLSQSMESMSASIGQSLKSRGSISQSVRSTLINPTPSQSAMSSSTVMPSNTTKIKSKAIISFVSKCTKFCVFYFLV